MGDLFLRLLPVPDPERVVGGGTVTFNSGEAYRCALEVAGRFSPHDEFGFVSKATPRQVDILKREYGDGWWCPMGFTYRLAFDKKFYDEWVEAMVTT